MSLYAELLSIGRTSLRIGTEACRRGRDAGTSEKATDARFAFVAIGTEGRPRLLAGRCKRVRELAMVAERLIASALFTVSAAAPAGPASAHRRPAPNLPFRLQPMAASPRYPLS